jgi:hypothetical protein
MNFISRYGGELELKYIHDKHSHFAVLWHHLKLAWLAYKWKSSGHDLYG